MDKKCELYGITFTLHPEMEAGIWRLELDENTKKHMLTCKLYDLLKGIFQAYDDVEGIEVPNAATDGNVKQAITFMKGVTELQFYRGLICEAYVF